MKTSTLAVLFLCAMPMLHAQNTTLRPLPEIKQISLGAYFRNDPALAQKLMSQCETWLKQDPANPHARYWLAYNQVTLLGTLKAEDSPKELFQNTYRAAEENLRALTTVPGFESEAYVLLGGTRALASRFDPAKTPALTPDECFTRAERFDASNPRLYLLKGLYHFYAQKDAGDNAQQAIDLYEKGIQLARGQKPSDELKPDWGLLEGQAYLACAYERAGRLDEARHLYEEVLSHRPDYALVTKEFFPELLKRLSSMGEFGLSPVFYGSPENRAALDEVLACEKSQNDLAGEKGMREAYMAYLAEDSMCFRAGPVREYPVQEQKPVQWPWVPSWTPEIADISLAGDLALTFDPVQTHEIASNSPPGSEHGLSIWRKEPDGAWKQVFDAGISHGYVSLSIRQVLFPGRAKLSGAAVDTEQEARALLALDREFGGHLRSNGLAQAYAAIVAENVYLCRTGSFPMTGKETVEAYLKELPGSWSWSPMTAVVAKSGDLAYSYGTFDRLLSEAGKDNKKPYSYIRVWKRNSRSEWKLFMELVRAFPSRSA